MTKKLQKAKTTSNNITYSFINVKTERLTLQYNLSRRTATIYMWLVPTLPRRTATNDTTVTQDSHNQA